MRTQLEEVWLWRHGLGGERALPADCPDIPALHGLRIASYYDPRCSSLVLRLRFYSSGLEMDALGEWAPFAGLVLIDTGHWSANKRAQFSADLQPFRCRTPEAGEAESCVLRLAANLRRESCRFAEGTLVDRPRRFPRASAASLMIPEIDIDVSDFDEELAACVAATGAGVPAERLDVETWNASTASTRAT